MENKKLDKVNKALLDAGKEAREIADELAPTINELSKKENKTENELELLENAEYAYTYLKDALEGISRIRVALRHSDIFLKEYNNNK